MLRNFEEEEKSIHPYCQWLLVNSLEKPWFAAREILWGKKGNQDKVFHTKMPKREQKWFDLQISWHDMFNEMDYNLYCALEDWIKKYLIHNSKHWKCEKSLWKAEGIGSYKLTFLISFNFNSFDINDISICWDITASLFSTARDF